MSGYPDNNPKTAIGVTKVPLHLIPPAAKHHMALAFADGAAKYGPYNWRGNKVSTSVYVGAAQRHLDAFWDGENLSRDARVHHLGHVMACCAILLDAESIGMLNDDRPALGAVSQLQADYADRNKPAGPAPTVVEPPPPKLSPNAGAKLFIGGKLMGELEPITFFRDGVPRASAYVDTWPLTFKFSTNLDAESSECLFDLLGAHHTDAAEPVSAVLKRIMRDVESQDIAPDPVERARARLISVLDSLIGTEKIRARCVAADAAAVYARELEYISGVEHQWRVSTDDKGSLRVSVERVPDETLIRN